MENWKPAIQLSDISGYNKEYITARIKSDFNSLIGSILPYAQSGDFVLTRVFLDHHIQSGDQVELQDDDYYYAINGGLVTCGGRQLGNTYNATFVRTTSAVCSTGGAIMGYNEFQLI